MDGLACFTSVPERVADYLLEKGADASISDQCEGLPEDWERVPMSVRQKLRESRLSG